MTETPGIEFEFCQGCQEVPAYCRCPRDRAHRNGVVHGAVVHRYEHDEDYYTGIPPVGAADGPPPKRDEPTGDGPDSWAPIDLGPYLRGEIVRPEPTLGMVRTDGLRLLYPGKEHAAIGEMESGKSWFALASVAVELNAENHVVYAHFEECDPSDSVDRLVALGVRDQDILRFLHFVGPEQPVNAASLAQLLEPAPTLVVFDGVNEAMSPHSTHPPLSEKITRVLVITVSSGFRAIHRALSISDNGQVVTIARRAFGHQRAGDDHAQQQVGHDGVACLVDCYPSRRAVQGCTRRIFPGVGPDKLT